jgi:GGDEF domain-containing protein
LKAFAATVQTAAKHLIHTTDDSVESCREGLLAAASMIAASGGGDAFRDGATATGASLERFGSEGNRYIQSLRSNLTQTTAMVQRMMTQLSGMGGDHHEALHGDIQELKVIAQSNSLLELRAALEEAAARMAERLEQLKREQQLIIAALQDEIRTLHLQLSARSTAPAPPPSSITPLADAVAAAPAIALEPAVRVIEGMRRDSFEKALQLKVEQGEIFSVSILWLSNLANLFTRYDSEIVLEVMHRASGRLEAALINNPLWTRWEDDCFVVATSEPKSAAARSSQDLANQLSGQYTSNKDGRKTDINLRVVVGLVERTKPDNAEKTFQRISQMIRNLRNMQ